MAKKVVKSIQEQLEEVRVPVEAKLAAIALAKSDKELLKAAANSIQFLKDAAKAMRKVVRKNAPKKTKKAKK